jgi:hypothetical protein
MDCLCVSFKLQKVVAGKGLVGSDRFVIVAELK